MSIFRHWYFQSMSQQNSEPTLSSKLSADDTTTCPLVPVGHRLVRRNAMTAATAVFLARYDVQSQKNKIKK